MEILLYWAVIRFISLSPNVANVISKSEAGVVLDLPGWCAWQKGMVVGQNLMVNQVFLAHEYAE